MTRSFEKRNSNTSFILMAFLLLLGTFQITYSQTLYPLGGGSRFESDPSDKKHLVLIAENSEVKITLKPSDKFKPKKGDIWVFWMKVENLTDIPMTFNPTKFNATDDEGRALDGLEAKEAIGRFEDAIAGTMNAVGLIFAGPLAGPSMVKAGERGSNRTLNQWSLQRGYIPAKTFKDGLVYLEKSKTKTKEVKVTFVGLWSEPIVFTTDEKLRPKQAK